ncbi:MAG: pentapeptide repeat-containing protein [Leptolyngbya sp. IPPAS B-1204]
MGRLAKCLLIVLLSWSLSWAWSLPAEADWTIPMSFSNADLHGRDFSGQELQGSEFSNAHLERTSFAEADVRGWCLVLRC